MSKTYLFDVEANGIGRKATRIWCIAIKDRDTKEKWFFGPDEIEQGIKKLQEATDLIAHNGVMFDVPQLQRIMGCKLPPCFDTLLMSRIMYPDIYDHPLGSNELKAWGEFLHCPKGDYDGPWDAYSEEMGTYCVQDVEVLDKIMDYQMANGQHLMMALKIETGVAKYIAKQIQNGMTFDIEGCYKFQHQLTTDMAAIEDQLQEAFPPITHKRVSSKTGKPLRDQIEVFNVGSRPQIVRRLVEKYKWNPTVYTAPSKTHPMGQVVVDEVVLGKLEYPEAKLLLRWFLLKKRIEHVIQWIANYDEWGDGRIHGDVNPLGCVSSRMSHKQPNLAQVTKVQIAKATKKPILGEAGGYGWESRSLFRASPGMVLVGADLSGLELRCLANRMWRWDNGAYAKVLLEGDIHTVNMEAAELDSRDNAKTFIYAFLYGAGDAKIGKIVGGDAEDGKRLKAKFLAGLPALGSLLAYVKWRTKKHGSIIGIDGRLIPVRSEHMALNTQLQSDGAIIAKVAFVLANKALQDKPVKFLLNIHDEFQVECPPEMGHEVGKTLVSCMEQAGKLLKVMIPITGEYKIGQTWAETH